MLFCIYLIFSKVFSNFYLTSLFTQGCLREGSLQPVNLVIECAIDDPHLHFQLGVMCRD